MATVAAQYKVGKNRHQVERAKRVPAAHTPRAAAHRAPGVVTKRERIYKTAEHRAQYCSSDEKNKSV